MIPLISNVWGRLAFGIVLLFGVTVHGSDERWGREFAAAGFGHDPQHAVQAVIRGMGGELIYFGGSLPDERGDSFSGIRLEGNRRVGFVRTDGEIHAAVAGGSEVYIAGSFRNVNGAPALNIARWNGSEWSALGAGLNGIVEALEFKDGNLFAGGRFVVSGQTLIGNVARWDGSAWHSVGFLNWSRATAPFVVALEFVGERLVVAGGFDFADGIAATNVAVFAEGKWTSLGEGAENGADGAVQSIAKNDVGEILIGGSFRRAGSVETGPVAKWNGTGWEALGSRPNRPEHGGITDIEWFDGKLYAAGSINNVDGADLGFASWDGERWNAVPHDVARQVRRMFVDGERMWVSARLSDPLSPLSPMGLLTFDGSNWKRTGHGLQTALGQPISVEAIGGSVLVAGNITSGFGFSEQDAVGEWNGDRWSLRGAPVDVAFDGRTEINDVEHADGETYITGAFESAGGVMLNGVARWVDGAWAPLGGGLGQRGLVVKKHGADLYVGHANGLSRWDGNAWAEVGNLEGEVRALAFDGTTVYAGGVFPASNMARWNGTAWEALGPGVNGAVSAMVFWNGSLFVGGEFSETGGAVARGIARWDGNAWSEVGGGVGGGRMTTAVSAMELDGRGGLFVAGDFRTAGGEAMESAARWTGERWEALGSGVNGPVRDIALTARDLFLAGDFRLAGGHESLRVARWRLQESSFGEVRMGGDGVLRLVARGPEAARFALESSVDLIRWRRVSENAFAAGGVELSVAPAEAGAEFYRLVDLE